MAIPGAEACREPYRDLRGLARLRPQRDTSFYGQPLSVFQARHGHDRGGRVCYRMALDHPKHVERLAVLDVIPILEGWSRADARFAQTYWPWILLAQEQPLPESYLLGAPKAVFENPFGHGSFGPELLEEYLSTYRDP